MGKTNTLLERIIAPDTLENIILNLVDLKDGKAIRELVTEISNIDDTTYLKTMLTLDKPIISGLASSVLYERFGYFDQVVKEEYGGLGIKLTTTGDNLHFGGHQLWFAQLGGNALSGSTNSESALSYSTNSGSALSGSTNSKYALFNSTNSESALSYSTNSESALRHSTNSGSALSGSKNSESALRHSTRSLFNRIFARIKRA